MSEKLITILGPTAVGKTKFAVELAEKFNGEIISADSRQVYKHMNIGTGKDIKDYHTTNGIVNYHLIDILEPWEEFDLYKFRKEFVKVFNDIQSKGKNSFLVGGSGMYISSVIQNYNIPPVDFNSTRYKELYELEELELRKILLTLKPEQHNVTDLIRKERLIKAILVAEQSRQKMPQSDLVSLNIGILQSRDLIKKNITTRLKIRLNEGMIDEVRNLLKIGVTFEKLKFFGLEYKFIGMYLNKELNYNDMYQQLNSAIHQFAKRQMTWFRKMEKEGVTIYWVSPGDKSYASELISKFING